MWRSSVKIIHIDFMALTATYNWEPSVALMLVTATQDDLAVDDTSVGLGPNPTTLTLGIFSAKIESVISASV